MKINHTQVIVKIWPESDGNKRNVSWEEMSSTLLKGLLVVCLYIKTNHEHTSISILVTEVFLGLFNLLMFFFSS